MQLRRGKEMMLGADETAHTRQSYRSTSTMPKYLILDREERSAI